MAERARRRREEVAGPTGAGSLRSIGADLASAGLWLKGEEGVPACAPLARGGLWRHRNGVGRPDLAVSSLTAGWFGAAGQLIRWLCFAPESAAFWHVEAVAVESGLLVVFLLQARTRRLP